MEDRTEKNDTTMKVAAETNVNVMTLNCNKAGMEGLDKEKINQIIEAASKGSKVSAHSCNSIHCSMFTKRFSD